MTAFIEDPAQDRIQSYAVFVMPGVYDTSLALTLDMLAIAQQVSGRSARVMVLTWDGAPVHTARGFTRAADGAFVDAAQCDVLIVPGMGCWSHRMILDALTSEPGQKAVEALASAHALGCLIAASCSSVFLMAESGLLNHKQATTSWWLSVLFRERYPDIQLLVERVIVQGTQTLCAGAVMAHADLMLALITRCWGVEVAQRMGRYLLIEQTVYQPQYLLAGLGMTQEPDIDRALSWIRLHLSESFSISDLARAIGLSPRTLARRFHAHLGQRPLDVVQHLRIQHTIFLLRTTSQSIDDIALDVGYANTSSLRRLLKRHTGQTPSYFRAPGVMT